MALEKDPLGCDEHSVSDGGCLGKTPGLWVLWNAGTLPQDIWVVTDLGCQPDRPGRREPPLKNFFHQIGPWCIFWSLIMWESTAHRGWYPARQVGLGYPENLAEQA